MIVKGLCDSISCSLDAGSVQKEVPNGNLSKRQFTIIASGPALCQGAVCVCRNCRQNVTTSAHGYPRQGKLPPPSLASCVRLLGLAFPVAMPPQFCPTHQNAPRLFREGHSEGNAPSKLPQPTLEGSTPNPIVFVLCCACPDPRATLAQRDSKFHFQTWHEVWRTFLLFLFGGCNIRLASQIHVPRLCHKKRAQLLQIQLTTRHMEMSHGRLLPSVSASK